MRDVEDYFDKVFGSFDDLCSDRLINRLIKITAVARPVVEGVCV